jgi:GNAT superfamily N-acetyltransferase
VSIAFRTAGAGDRRFIVDAWAGSYRDADSAGFIQVEDWYPVMIPQLSKALDRPDVATTIAYETANPDPSTNAYGFIVADVVERPAVVYYVYVKEAYRRSGLARRLFEAIGVEPSLPFFYVCSTPMAASLKRKVPMARWKPLVGRFPKHERRPRHRRIR